MFFGQLATVDALDCYLAHSQKTRGGRIAKGTKLDKALIETLLANGIDQLLVARLDTDDVHENNAATEIAQALCGEGVSLSKPRAGRVNLHAIEPGLCAFDRHAILTANSIDEAATIATIAENQWVAAGRMLATVKIIPYSVRRESVDAVTALLSAARLDALPANPRNVTLIQTQLPAVAETVLDKTVKVTRARLEQRSAVLLGETRCKHTIEALSKTIKQAVAASPDWLLIAGASAISDRNDVIPAAITAAGGDIERYGLPVDPGNLLLLASIGTTVVIGLPGCARSPRYNGLDQLLDRLACGVPITDEWINSLSVGGLLTEVADRPRPRVSLAEKPKVSGLILAAGLSSRAGAVNKLQFKYQQKPLVNHVADALKAADLHQVIAVTGHQHKQVEAALGNSDVEAFYNPAYESGMASSLVLGISKLIESDAIIVCLGDMPNVTSSTIEKLHQAFLQHRDKAVFIPCYQGKRGNPVLLSKLMFDTLLALKGDSGAKFLARQYPQKVMEVDVDSEGILQDYDTEAELQTLANNSASNTLEQTAPQDNLN